ncbi:MAG TPA: glycosyltransferase family 9 protein, partial [Ignavibacteriaceae bacterium]|nr:glycosyltransferase family 9 protein [Ignavibacteriaceae bacterium]
KKFISDFKKEAGINENDFVVGFNTGCSELYPNKKMTIDQHIYLIDKLLARKKYKIALFGGPEDIQRNESIYSKFKGKTGFGLAEPRRIINTPANLGVRKGACFEDIADLIITGDSFGMHLGVALKKFVIVWFGVSCWTEIDLYERGIKLFPEDLFCSPCWKMECPYNLECIKQIDLDRIVREVDKYYQSLSVEVKKQA